MMVVVQGSQIKRFNRGEGGVSTIMVTLGIWCVVEKGGRGRRNLKGKEAVGGGE